MKTFKNKKEIRDAANKELNRRLKEIRWGIRQNMREISSNEVKEGLWGKDAVQALCDQYFANLR